MNAPTSPKLTIKEAVNTVNQAAEAGTREMEAVIAAIQAGRLDDAAHHAKYVRANLADIAKITAAAAFAE